VNPREAEKLPVEMHEPLAKRHAAECAERRAHQHDHDRELQVVHSDLRVCEAERLQNRDLVALQRHLAVHDRVDHENRDS